ncbi:hypothetical protein V2J09_005199 [Rumex salicifolius]
MKAMRRYATLVRVFRWHRNHAKMGDLERLINNESSSLLVTVKPDQQQQQQQGRIKDAVPKGFLPVYVGSGLRRVVIPTAYLSTPEFREVMERAEEEFGFQQNGGLQLPCTDQEFDDLIFIYNRNYS